MQRPIHITNNNDDRWIRLRRPAAMALLLAVLALGVTAGAWVSGLHNLDGAGMLLAAATTAPIADQLSLSAGFTPVVERVLPAVVSISSEKMIRFADSGPTFPFFSDPSSREYFDEDLPHRYNHPHEQRERSLGSGVIISADGYLLTNNHVVENASEIRVLLPDKREMKGKVVGTDPRTDIAVLKLDGKNLPVLPVADSSKVKAGQFVLAIGNPFGLGETVTMGIVSATGRGNLNITDYEDFIQTDAAINPGNSGGALVDVQGALIGINTAILSGNGGNQGIGFAVPINMARQVMGRLVKDGKVIRGWLGVVIQPVTPPIAKAMKLEKNEGALIGDVTPGSPAAKAGIKRGDVVVAINGERISEARDLSLKVSMLPPGTTVHLKVMRDGRAVEVPVVLGEQPSERTALALGSEAKPGASNAMEGVEVEDITPPIRRQLGLPARMTGVIVTGVEPGSRAGEAGLRPGDIIQEVNRRPVASMSEFEHAVRQGGRDATLLLINRGGNTLFVVIE